MWVVPVEMAWYGVGMQTSELDYTLPPELIAQYPSKKRDESRLLVVERATGAIRFDVFKNIAGYLNAGDCVVMNDTRVIRARLRARKATGGQVEVFLLRETDRSAGAPRARATRSCRGRAGRTRAVRRPCRSR